jgi:hypothetical protein
LVPVTVTEYVPVGMTPVVKRLNVEIALPFATGVIDAGLKLQVILIFEGVQVSATVPLKPFSEFTVADADVLFPTITVPELGERATLKSFTVRLSEAE